MIGNHQVEQKIAQKAPEKRIEIEIRKKNRGIEETRKRKRKRKDKKRRKRTNVPEGHEKAKGRTFVFRKNKAVTKVQTRKSCWMCCRPTSHCGQEQMQCGILLAPP